MPETTDEPGTFTQPMTLPVSEGAQYPLKPSFDDARGIERVAGPAIETWKPAKIAPTDEEIAHHKAFLEADERQRQVRLGALGLPQHANVPPHSALDATEQGTKSPEQPDEGASPELPVDSTGPGPVFGTTPPATVAEDSTLEE